VPLLPVVVDKANASSTKGTGIKKRKNGSLKKTLHANPVPSCEHRHALNEVLEVDSPSLVPVKSIEDHHCNERILDCKQRYVRLNPDEKNAGSIYSREKKTAESLGLFFYDRDFIFYFKIGLEITQLQCDEEVISF
jgi:hypothetical protein